MGSIPTSRPIALQVIAPVPEPGKVYLGCSGWAYASWRPGFYPEKTPLKKLLEAYAARLNAVEVNYTFRSLPKAGVCAGWLGQTASRFRFAFKAPQRVTHFKRLRGCGELLGALAGSLAPMADRLGPVLFQLPPNFKADAELLDAFLAEAAAFPWRAAWEFRDASWFTDEIYDVLAKHRSALCAAESDALRSPDLPLAPGLRVFRLRKSRYTEAELAALGSHFAALAGEGEDVYGFFMHEDAPDGPLRAAAVLAQIPRELRG